MKHIAIVSVCFDKSPEGICTGLLIRALLDYGFRITLITSDKAKLGFTHSNLHIISYKSKPREPRALIKLIAKLSGNYFHPFYFWAKKASTTIFKDDIPDLFYGRAWPYSSLIPAKFLAEKYQKPFVAHLSDPVPPPNETPNKTQSDHLQQLANYCSAITFTNDETIKYQRRFTNIAENKCHNLPHVGPTVTLLEASDSSENYYYIGAIGNRKSALGLLFDGFKRHMEMYPNASLNFVNPKDSEISPAIQKHKARPFVKILPFLEDINDAFRPAKILISLEPKVDEPMWTLTKTVHYLFTNRIIFALTSPNSPTQRMLSEHPDSCVVVTEYTPEAIQTGLNKARELAPSNENFARRHKAMNDFTPLSVALKFDNIINAI